MPDITTSLSSITYQRKRLLEILLKSPSIKFLLNNAHRLGINDWYIGAGAISQTIWNHQKSSQPENNLLDLDLIYYDGDDLSKKMRFKFKSKQM